MHADAGSYQLTSCFVFWDRVSKYKSNQPGTHCVAGFGFHSHYPTSTSQVLGLQATATMASSISTLCNRSIFLPREYHSVGLRQPTQTSDHVTLGKGFLAFQIATGQFPILWKISENVSQLLPHTVLSTQQSSAQSYHTCDTGNLLRSVAHQPYLGETEWVVLGAGNTEAFSKSYRWFKWHTAEKHLQRQLAATSRPFTADHYKTEVTTTEGNWLGTSQNTQTGLAK